jgi:hypothetical protein
MRCAASPPGSSYLRTDYCASQSRTVIDRCDLLVPETSSLAYGPSVTLLCSNVNAAALTRPMVANYSQVVVEILHAIADISYRTSAITRITAAHQNGRSVMAL